jgi:uncharacterized phage protein (TIGR01671 family)
MRTIKFRGLRLDGKGWVVGSLLCPHAGNESTYIIGCNGSDFEVKPETVGQFTGLTDKNGVEVFEGDIIGELVVSYSGDNHESLGMHAGWYLQRDNFESWMELESDFYHEVTGNIHEQ